MKNILISVCLTLLLIVLVGTEQSRRAYRPAAPAADSCTACHAVEGTPLSAGHDATAMGCSPCHLGNGAAYDKDRAHHGMVMNPGDLRVADATCGRGGCHPALARRVKTSVMATAAGMLTSLDALWGSRGPRDAALLWAADAPRDPARDYWAKLCAACHLWWSKGRGLGEQRLRGGGCSACHVAGPQPPSLENAGVFRHARLTMVVPLENCVRCHNRSARIGLSYQGLAEDHGSGGPHVDGALSPLRLSGGRYAVRVRPDVHFTAGMTCIDCHTGAELMGDGTAHPRLRGQLDIACADCHRPRFLAPPAPGERLDEQGARALHAARAEGRRLAAMHPAIPPLRQAPLAHTAAKGTPLYALRLKALPQGRHSGKAELLRKADGKALTIPLRPRPLPQHALRGHERLACQACHSPLMPQCYGCHVTMDTRAVQQDLLLGRETPGRWSERLDYARLRSPALGVKSGSHMTPFSPCQVLVTVVGPGGRSDPALSRAGMDMTPFDPHTTRTRSRTCLDCHLSPKTLATEPRGARATGSVPALPGENSGHGYPGLGDRGLSPGELDAVLGVAPCLPCHGEYDDAVYLDFGASRSRLRRGDAPRCRCPEPARGAHGAPTLSSNTH